MIRICLIGLIAALVSCPQFVSGDETSLRDIARAVSKHKSVLGEILKLDGTNLGTGFAVAGGKVITAGHVAVGDTLLFDPFGKDNEPVRIALGYKVRGLDLAILSPIDQTLQYCLKLGDFDRIGPGDSILYFGFIRDTLKVRYSTVYSQGQMLNDGAVGQFIEFQSDAEPGFSGGPVFNRRAEVVAIIVHAYDMTDAKGKRPIRFARAVSTNFLRIRETLVDTTTAVSTPRLTK
ncbi:MAG: serine protease [candidate division Zixibacteria bacterium]|nr:serine protease [candidate division Zixibacteria bacterium]